MTEPNEASRYDNGEPGTSPALPTGSDIRRNFAEWKAEVETRVDIAVTNTLRNGRHPSEADVCRLGAEGRRLYYERLSKAAVETAPALATAISAASVPSETTQCTGSLRVTSARPSARTLLINELDWRSRQNRRPSYTARASEEGVQLLLLLTTAFVLVLHALPDQGVFSRLSRLLEVFR